MNFHDRFTAVFKHLGSYVIARGITPDQHESQCETKQDALLAARQLQADNDDDPGFVLDLTNAAPAELTAYLR
jgi:hypothetical protein